MGISLTSNEVCPLERKDYSLGIISIATKKYFDYWTSLAESIERNYQELNDLELILFTDVPEKAQKWSTEKPNLSILVIGIPSYGWPEATLFRYKIINAHTEFFTHRTLMYVDADSLMNSKFNIEDFREGSQTKMTFVEHPGYWRPENKILFYIKNPNLFIRDLIRVIWKGGNGAWETNRNSKAFVPRALRKKYYCGGVWFGPNKEFHRFCSELHQKVEDDLKANYIAKWHDESHLNNWATINSINTAGPELCYAAEFKHLIGIKNRITAVKKG